MDMTSLGKLVRLIRYYILTSTTTAGSGHATSALSAVELATMLFFKYLRADLDHPENFANDRFILSKGHASPLLYALYAAAGKVTEEELLKLRTLESPLEGHPTMRFPWTEVPTGSLGQGLSVAIGEAIALRVKYQGFGIKGLGTDLSFLNTKYGPLNTLPRIFVLMGDGELAEGQIWEAIQLAKYYKLNNIIALIDVNRLGQSQETMYGTDARALATRIAGFGWKTYVVENGHDFGLLDKAYSLALEQAKASDVPSAILVRTVKGKGVSFLEDKEGWHGIALKKDELEKALGELGEVDKADRGLVQKPSMEYQGVSIKGLGSESFSQNPNTKYQSPNTLAYKLNEPTATRKAFGNALLRLGQSYSNMVVLDADVQNSTYAELFAKKFPDRFYQMFIAEQNMVSAAVGMAKIGLVPVVVTFGCFLTRAFDQLRMAALSGLHIVVCGSHAGVSIGQDGPSQMGLEDIALFRSLPGSTVLYPSDAVSCDRLVEEALTAKGIVYIRTTRLATPVIYEPDQHFATASSHIFEPSESSQDYVLRSQYQGVRNKKLLIRNTNTQILVSIVAAGITLHEALKAQKQLSEEGIPVRVIDCYSIKPLDKEALRDAAGKSTGIVVVEDHYPEGGLGEAVTSALSDGENSRKIVHLAVHKIPRSGKSDELLAWEGISSVDIMQVVQRLITT